MLSFYHFKLDKLAPALSNSNFHPKSTVVEVGAFSPVGYGPWASSTKPLSKGLEWKTNPWELVPTAYINQVAPELSDYLKGKSNKTYCLDSPSSNSSIHCGSSTALSEIQDGSYDLVVTDPPFGGLLHYSELSDFFHVWLREYYNKSNDSYLITDYTPKTLEAVANKAREPEDADGFYQRILTECWKEASRALKPGGLLSFTFHHSEDAPWFSVLESLFDSGFYLEATYPIRSDETKGAGQFGARLIEYDIIHVCRKLHDEPSPISWAKLRRQILKDIRELKELLEHHQTEGLLEADMQVIRRGKALEYFSKHYGKVYKEEDKPISVLRLWLASTKFSTKSPPGSKKPHHITPNRLPVCCCVYSMQAQNSQGIRYKNF